MKLSTLTCADPRCDREVTGDLAMFHLVNQAVEQGWTFSEDSELDNAYCPEHSAGGPDPTPKWLVGCWTCSDEWDAESEEEAKAQASDHDCEADTYIKSPKQLNDAAVRRAEYEATRKERMKEEEAQVLAAAELATARQQEIESWARNWLRLRNTLVFWRKKVV